MKSLIQRGVRRHPVAAMVVFNLAMIGFTAMFTSIWLGPDSGLDDKSCTKRCIHSHGQAEVTAIVFAAMTVWLLWLTIRLYRSGRLKRRDESEAGEEEEEALLRAEEDPEADR